MQTDHKPLSAEAYFIAGNEKRTSGDYKGAIAAYTQAIQVKPDFARAYYNRGEVNYPSLKTWACDRQTEITARRVYSLCLVLRFCFSLH